MCLLIICTFFWPSKILLITEDQVQLRSVHAKFHADRTKSHGVQKVGFPVFAILRKNFLGRSGRGHCIVIQLHSGNLGIQGFWMCNIRCGSYRQKRVGLCNSAPCRRIYVFFCVWDICRSLNQPSKVHRPPLHGLACSTTFSQAVVTESVFFSFSSVTVVSYWACTVCFKPNNTEVCFEFLWWMSNS